MADFRLMSHNASKNGGKQQWSTKTFHDSNHGIRSLLKSFWCWCCRIHPCSDPPQKWLQIAEHLSTLPNTENELDHILIVGQTGAGKSSFIADYLREIIQMGQKTIFIFTASTKPEPYDKLNPYNKVVKNLQSKILEEGRKFNINVLSSSHLDLATKELVISQYKTAESHGTREIKISDELAQILTDFKNELNFSFLVCSNRS